MLTCSENEKKYGKNQNNETKNATGINLHMKVLVCKSIHKAIAELYVQLLCSLCQASVLVPSYEINAS